MSTMTTTTYRPAAKLATLDVIITVHGEYAEVREVRPLGGDRVTVDHVGPGGGGREVYPAAHMVEVVVPDPHARITTHIDDVAVGDVVIMPVSDAAFPRPVEVMVEVTRVGEVHRRRDGAPVQTVYGRAVCSHMLVDITVGADDGQLDVVGNVADSAAAGA